MDNREWAGYVNNELRLRRMSVQEFAEHLSEQENGYNQRLNYLLGSPNIYLLAQYVDVRTRDRENIYDNIDLYNELWRRSREYALSLPYGSLERRIYHNVANEIDRPVQPQPRVVRGPFQSRFSGMR